jgi:hypothetical protein
MNCTICLDEYNEPYKLSCNHTFCFKCIQKSLVLDNKVCPLCRKLIINNDINQLIVDEHIIDINTEDMLILSNHTYFRLLLRILIISIYICILSYIVSTVILIFITIFKFEYLKYIQNFNIKIYMLITICMWNLILNLIPFIFVKKIVLFIFGIFPFNQLYNYNSINE